MSKAIDCASCGFEIEDPESGDAYWHEDYKTDICGECYLQETDKCQLCGNEDLMPSDKSEFIVVKCELGKTANRPPGIYRIMSRPFLSIPLIGSGSMDGGDVKFVDRLPKRDCEYDISGHICKNCARPYAKTFKEVYGTLASERKNDNSWRSPLWPPAMTFCGNQRGGRKDKRWTYSWWLQLCHVQQTVATHPAMLQDLECEPDHWDWADMFKLFDLADRRTDEARPWTTKWVCRYKTWHDWLAFEHRGIKIYFTSEHEGMYGEHKWHDLCLSPDPKYRQMARNNETDPMLIYTRSLPTIKLVEDTYHLRHLGFMGKPASLWHKHWDGHWSKNNLLAIDLKAAVMLAIDRGAEGYWRNAPGSIHADGIVLEKAA